MRSAFVCGIAHTQVYLWRLSFSTSWFVKRIKKPKRSFVGNNNNNKNNIYVHTVHIANIVKCRSWSSCELYIIIREIMQHRAEWNNTGGGLWSARAHARGWWRWPNAERKSCYHFFNAFFCCCSSTMRTMSLIIRSNMFFFSLWCSCACDIRRRQHEKRMCANLWRASAAFIYLLYIRTAAVAYILRDLSYGGRVTLRCGDGCRACSPPPPLTTRDFAIVLSVRPISIIEVSWFI